MGVAESIIEVVSAVCIGRVLNCVASLHASSMDIVFNGQRPM
jgi:hypothetical protein